MSVSKPPAVPTDPNIESHMIFLCPECGKEMGTRMEWRRHLNSVHQYANKRAVDFNFKEIDDKHHECQVCLKWVTNGHQTPAVLQYHRFHHLPYSKIYRCKHCRGCFLRKRSLSEHLHRVHSRLMNKTSGTTYRPQVVPEKPAFRDPKLNKEFYIRFLCPLCGKLFERFQFWLQHLDSAHASTSIDLKMHRIAGTKSYYCGECSYTLKNGPSRSELQRHHFTHLPYNTFFQCAFCYSRKAYKTELLLHYMKYHTAEYLKHRRFIYMPDEWGGEAQEAILKEIRRLMELACKKPKSDILQRALHDINLDDEPHKAMEMPVAKFNHEQALDQSLDGYENVFVVEMENNPTTSKRGCVKFSDITENELESICEEMFEEVIDYSPPFGANDSLHKDMQKYIHYLCPECGNEFDDQHTWRSHVYEQHNLINAVESKFRPLNGLKTIHLCLVCHQVQRTSKHADLRRHHFQHMPFQSYLKCIICSKTKSSKPKMIQHLEYVHMMHIKKETIMPNPSRMSSKRYHCLECDKTYAVLARFKSHCRTCPKRLGPLSVGKCDISKNKKLLEHLYKASERIDQMLKEVGVEIPLK